MIEIIISHLEKILNPQIEYKVEEEDATAASASASVPSAPEPVSISTLVKDDGSGTGNKFSIDFNYGTENGSLFIENTVTGKHAYFKIAVDPITKNSILLYSIDENRLGGHL